LSIETGRDACVNHHEQGGEARRWLVAMTQPHREAVAVEHLIRQDFTTYCPMVLKRVRHARQMRDVRRPLFPGYVFIAYDAGLRWQAVRSTIGVRTLVRRGDEPDFLDGAFVAALQAREREGVIVKPSAPFDVGQSVSITHGPLANLVGEIVELRESERVMILLKLMGQHVRTILGTDVLRAAE